MVDMVVSKSELIDAQKDAQALDDIVNGAAEVRVQTRLGRYVWTLATLEQRSLLLIDQWQSAISMVTTGSGTPALAISDASGKNQQQINNLIIDPDLQVPSDKMIRTWSGRTQEQHNRDFVSVKDFGAIGDGYDHPLSEFFPSLALAQAIYPFATSLGMPIDYCAHKAAALTGKNIYTPSGDYVFKQPLLLTTVGQVWKGDGMGYGYGSPEFALKNYVGNTRIIGKGTFTKRILTRRNPRITVAELPDPAMSAIVEVHAMGVHLRDFAVWLDCDYANMSPTNYGADIDIGIFVGCQAGFKHSNVAVLGYFRKVGLYLDVTRATNLPSLLNDVGQPLPPTFDFAGGDGTQVDTPYVRGARVAMAVLGPIPDMSGKYYDDTMGLVTDMRGAAGFSDFMVIGGRLYAGGHHSGRRLADPITPLTRANGESADTFSPAALYIDGWALNSGSTTNGQGAIRGMCFINTRFASPEMFRVRLGRCDEVFFVGRAWIELGTNSKPIYSTNGTDINANDYVNYTYGHIFMDSVTTGSVRADAPTGGVATPWALSDRFTTMDARGRSHTGAVVIEDSSASIESSSYYKALLEIKDTGEADFPKPGIRIHSYNPSIVLSDRSAGVINDFKMEMNNGILRMLLGNSDSNSFDDSFLELSVNSNTVRLSKPLKIPNYTVSTIPDYSSVGFGAVVLCLDGNSGQPCLAISSGGSWKRIPIGADISSS